MIPPMGCMPAHILDEIRPKRKPALTALCQAGIIYICLVGELSA
jgi:hypothetical protein